MTMDDHHTHVNMGTDSRPVPPTNFFLNISITKPIGCAGSGKSSAIFQYFFGTWRLGFCPISNKYEIFIQKIYFRNSLFHRGIQSIKTIKPFSFCTLELYEPQPIKSFFEFFFEAIILYVVQAAYHYFQRRHL